MAYLADTFELDQTDRTTLVHNLRVTATHYDDHAEKASKAGLAKVAGRLTHQAAEARALADRLESSRYIRVGREVE